MPSGSYRVTILGVSGQVTSGSANVEVDYQTNTLLGVNPESLTTSPPSPAAVTMTLAHVGVFRNGTWILDTTHTEVYNSNDTVYSIGKPGNIPLPITLLP